MPDDDTAAFVEAVLEGIATAAVMRLPPNPRPEELDPVGVLACDDLGDLLPSTLSTAPPPRPTVKV